MPKVPGMSRTRPIRAQFIVAFVSLSTVLFISVYIFGHWFKPLSQFQAKLELQLQARHEPQHQFGSDIDPDDCTPTTLPIIDTPTSASWDNAIPNIVHYVWLLNGQRNFSVDFKIFVSVYSASLYFQPDKIYIHTDASPEQWAEAKNSNDATRWMLKIPNIAYHWIKPPKYTLNCVPIKRIEHISDFVRTQQLHHYGGVYLDTDILPLRDIRKLRESGFSNIVGIEDPGRINNGFMISKPRNPLLSIFMSEQHRVFDNQWLTHSVDLLSTLVYRLQAVPGEVIVLDIKAFAPTSWREDGIKTLFNPHTRTLPVPPEKNELPKIPRGFQDTVDYWAQRDWKGKEDWEVDYSSSYVIHAFDSMDHLEWPKRVDLEYVTARQSNYARAVYPAVKHAIDIGLIDKKPKLWRG